MHPMRCKSSTGDKKHTIIVGNTNEHFSACQIQKISFLDFHQFLFLQQGIVDVDDRKLVRSIGDNEYVEMKSTLSIGKRPAWPSIPMILAVVLPSPACAPMESGIGRRQGVSPTQRASVQNVSAHNMPVLERPF